MSETALITIVVAPFVGSFLGLLAARLPDGRPWALARSRCATCGRALAPPDLIPIVSWLALRGRCRTCGARIPIFHLALEAGAIVVAVWAVLATPGPLVLTTSVLGWLLLIYAFVEARAGDAADGIAAAVAVTGLAVGAVFHPARMGDLVIGVGAGGVALGLVVFAWARRGGRVESGAIEWASVKLFAAGGAWVGWRGLIGALLIATLAAGAVTVARVRRSKRPRLQTARAPFGACLALGVWLVWLYGPGA